MAYGARSVAGCLLRTGSPAWLWGLVAQDAVDLPFLSGVLTHRPPPGRARFQTTLAAFAVIAFIDLDNATKHGTGLEPPAAEHQADVRVSSR